MGERVHGYLVTGPDDARRSMWIATAAITNWLETVGRTTQVMCLDEDSERFLQAARNLGLTVEEIVSHEGDQETYKLLVGEPGTGWSQTAESKP